MNSAAVAVLLKLEPASRRTHNPLASAFGILLPSLLAPARVASAERLPNVILIVADDRGYADVDVDGAKEFAMPNLD